MLGVAASCCTTLPGRTGFVLRPTEYGPHQTSDLVADAENDVAVRDPGQGAADDVRQPERLRLHHVGDGEIHRGARSEDTQELHLLARDDGEEVRI